MENLVAIELFKKQARNPMLEIFYWKDSQQREVDFVVKEGNRVKQLIQVCWDLSDLSTIKRERNVLLSAAAAFKCDDLLIITQNMESVESFAKNGHEWKIRILPLRKWIFQESNKDNSYH